MNRNKIHLYFLLIIIIASFLMGRHLKPSGDKKLYKLAGISENETRSYYYLDDKGLTYSNLNKYIKDGETFVIKIIARSNISPHSNTSKSFGYELDITKNKKSINNKNLKYTKKIAEVTSSKNKKGFKFTQAGYWYEEFVMDGNFKFKINKIKGSPDVFVRVLIEKVDRSKTDEIIRSINKQNSYTISFTDKDKLIKSKNWILVNNNNEQKFKIEGPKIIRVGARYVYENENNSTNFSLLVKQDGLWMGSYLFEKQISDNNSIIINENKILSKFRSVYINVPDGIHYYSFEVPKNKEYKDDNILIKLDEFKVSQ